MARTLTEVETGKASLRGPKCCFIPDNEQDAVQRGESVPGCQNDAEWQIVSGSCDSDCTESCTEHIGGLLTDAAEQRIYPI